MRSKMHLKRRILISMLILFVLCIDCRSRLETGSQVLFCSQQAAQSELQAAAGTQVLEAKLHTTARLTSEQVKLDEIFGMHNYRNTTSGYSRYNWLLCMCVLLLLTALSQRKSRGIRLYDICYICRRFYHITYIQDKDGPKRTAMLLHL